MTDKYGGQTDQMGVYLNGATLIGIAEVKLPEVKGKQITLGAAGLLGDITIDSPSQIEAMETEFKFNSVNESVFNLWSAKGSLVELKAFINDIDGVSHAVDQTGYRVSLKGKASAVDLGTLKPAELMNTTVKFNTTFIEVRKEGKSLLKIDKINSIFEQFGISLIKSLASIA